MSNKNLLVLLVSVIALAAISAQSASAFGTITSVEVMGVNALESGVDLANFAGDRVPILITFRADSGTGVLAEDARIKAWISGESENVATSDRFDVLAGRTYTEVVYLDVPSDMRDELDERRKLEIVVESRGEGTADEVTIDFTVQRESYVLQILSADMQPEVNAGEPLVLDVVLKNRGRHFADDVFLDVSIPQLGLSTRTYYGDLAPVDQGGNEPDKEDAEVRRTYLRIPADVAPGLYTVVVEASSDESVDRVERRVLVTGGADENTQIVSSSTSKTFGVGETQTYDLTLVNRGPVVRVYTLSTTAPEALDVTLSDTVVIVPAGSSRTVEVMAASDVRDDYTFTVKVESDEGTATESKTFTANVIEGGRGGRSVATNTTVLLTVILAIVFIVLLVVLIVLLTRKPAKQEEFGESYY